MKVSAGMLLSFVITIDSFSLDSGYSSYVLTELQVRLGTSFFFFCLQW